MKTGRWIAYVLIAMILVMAGMPCVVTSITAAAEAVESAPSGDVVLEKGSQGEDVIWLQNALNQNGASLTVDGDYGNATAAAVSDFQEQHGLTVTGVADAATIAALTASMEVSDSAEAVSDGQEQGDAEEYQWERQVIEQIIDKDSEHIYRSYWHNFFAVAKSYWDEFRIEAAESQHPVRYAVQCMLLILFMVAIPVGFAVVCFVGMYLLKNIVPALLRVLTFGISDWLLVAAPGVYDILAALFTVLFGFGGPLLFIGLEDGGFVYAFYTHDVKECTKWAILFALTRIAVLGILFLLVLLGGAFVSKLCHKNMNKSFKEYTNSKPLKTLAIVVTALAAIYFYIVPGMMYTLATVQDSSVSML